MTSQILKRHYNLLRARRKQFPIHFDEIWDMELCEYVLIVKILPE